VILWDVATWRQLCHIESHSLTVTQLQFSHDGSRLLSVSRDRTWTVYQERKSEETVSYERIAYTDKKTAIHGRIIWSCSWSHDDKYFITVSRDKKALIWSEAVKDDGKANVSSCLGNFVVCGKALDLSESITAVDFAPSLHGNNYLIAFGLETGLIQLYSWSCDQPVVSRSQWSHLISLDRSAAHHLCVKRLRFQPQSSASSCHNTGLHLASCAEDNTVKIFHITLTNRNVT